MINEMKTEEYRFYTFTFKMPIETGGVIGSIYSLEETQERLETQLKEEVGEYELLEFRLMTDDEVSEIQGEEALEELLAETDKSLLN